MAPNVRGRFDVRQCVSKAEKGPGSGGAIQAGWVWNNEQGSGATLAESARGSVQRRRYSLQRADRARGLRRLYRTSRRFPPTWHPIPVHCSKPIPPEWPRRAGPFSALRHTVGTSKTSAHIWRHACYYFRSGKADFSGCIPSSRKRASP